MVAMCTSGCSAWTRAWRASAVACPLAATRAATTARRATVTRSPASRILPRISSSRPPTPHATHRLAGTLGAVDLFGVVNASPDSLHRDSVVTSPDEAVARGRRLLDDGAVALDLGGQGT